MSALLLLGLFGLLLLLLRTRKRRDGEPPLINGWIPFMGKALQFRKDAHKFLEEYKKKYGDVFTVHLAGKYMTFIMDPLLYPSVIRQGRQLDFHAFTGKVAPLTFGYKPVHFELWEKIMRSFQFLQGDNLQPLTESMMANLMLVFRQDHLDHGLWRSMKMHDFCYSVMFEATFLTMFGRPAVGQRHSGMEALREDFNKFDNMFPLLIAQVPIWVLGQTSSIRKKLIQHFLPQCLSRFSNASEFIKMRARLFEQESSMKDVDIGGHHFAMMWASAANTLPATFWAMYYLVSHPEALQTVRQEILDVLKDDGVEFSSDRDVNLCKKQLDKLVYLESSINESLRLSSASTNIRVAQEDFSLRLDASRAISVRKGDIIALYPQSMHLDPEIYEDPEKFRFDRFVQNGAEKTDFYKDGQKLRYYLMPFGSGSSMCPGRYFAVNEIKQFLSLLLLYFEMELEEGQPRPARDPGRAGLGILLPSTDVRFRFRLRTTKV